MGYWEWKLLTGILQQGVPEGDPLHLRGALFSLKHCNLVVDLLMLG